MPGANNNFNLGQDQRRYFNVFADRFACASVKFDAGTSFTGNFSELRDKPASVGQPDYYERLDFFSDTRLSLTTVQTTLR